MIYHWLGQKQKGYANSLWHGPNDQIWRATYEPHISRFLLRRDRFTRAKPRWTAHTGNYVCLIPIFRVFNNRILYQLSTIWFAGGFGIHSFSITNFILGMKPTTQTRKCYTFKILNEITDTACHNDTTFGEKCGSSLNTKGIKEVC